MEAVWLTTAGIVLAASVVSASILLGIWLGGRISLAGAARAINTYPADLRERVEKVERDMSEWGRTIDAELDAVETRRKKLSASKSAAARLVETVPETDAETRARIGRNMRA